MVTLTQLIRPLLWPERFSSRIVLAVLVPVFSATLVFYWSVVSAQGDDMSPTLERYLFDSCAFFLATVLVVVFVLRRMLVEVDQTREFDFPHVPQKSHGLDAEAQLNRSRLARALNIANLHLWEWDTATKTLSWSDEHGEMYQSYGPSLVTAFKDNVLSSVCPDDHTKVLGALAQVLRDKGRFVLEHGLVKQKGKGRVVSHRIDVCFGDGGQIVKVLGVLQDITRARLMVAASHKSEEQVRTILDNVMGAIVCIDQAGLVATFNKAAEVVFGYEAAEVVGQSINLLMSDDDARGHSAYLQRFVLESAKNESKSPEAKEFLARRKDGTFFPMEVAISGISVWGKNYFIGMIKDLTVHKQTEQNMRLSEQVFANAVEGIAVADENKVIVRTNLAFSSISGDVVDGFLGKKLDTVLCARSTALAKNEVWLGVASQGQWQGEIEGCRRNGEPYLAWVTVTEIKNDTGTVSNYIVVINDITEIKEAQSRIHHLINFDVLTNLPNRSLFQDRLAQGIAQASRVKNKLALLRIDLDHFKKLNETLGDSCGDLLLKRVAQRLVESVRQCDTVSRLSGDEYAVMLTNLNLDSDASGVSRKILKAFSLPFDVGGQEVFVSVSIGVALFPLDAHTVEDMVKHAGAAMHHVKEHGRNSYRMYTGDLDASAFEHLVLANSLRRALERDEFVLYYQPQLNLRSGKMTGVEALIRWNHPDLGMISPAQFVPLLEESGLIMPVGEWVLTTACEQARAWGEAGYEFVRVAVNLSPRQIGQKNLVALVVQAIEASGIDPCRLDLEITESSLMDDMDQSIKMLSELKDMGVSVSIDDFGTGYSSLSYLTRLPIDTLKIDRSFVQDVIEDSADATLAGAIVSMGHSLKLNVLAEGVETPEQLAFLQSQGCDEVQGFLFSRPLPAEEVVELFDSDMRALLCETNH